VVAEVTVAEVTAELAALEDPKTRELNEKLGDDHGVNLSKLRALARRLKIGRDSRASSGIRTIPRRDCDPDLPPAGIRA
jgi:hypothetical protein